eukprot:gnl/Spiro4/9180_TR4832_c0_g1_i1.p1 gnl/Spiro4/9180_TR4832_c0_g1~~gnl/Spiro4/9180_TR4832_c0_g1_i1.p1  ORF type:complete len:333 (-),score=84.18 gnl/Spiro4/9180_TR4832_c0_g1_i1:141-1082(-)
MASSVKPTSVKPTTTQPSQPPQQPEISLDTANFHGGVVVPMRMSAEESVFVASNKDGLKALAPAQLLSASPKEKTEYIIKIKGVRKLTENSLKERQEKMALLKSTEANLARKLEEESLFVALQEALLKKEEERVRKLKVKADLYKQEKSHLHEHARKSRNDLNASVRLARRQVMSANREARQRVRETWNTLKMTRTGNLDATFTKNRQAHSEIVNARKELKATKIREQTATRAKKHEAFVQRLEEEKQRTANAESQLKTLNAEEVASLETCSRLTHTLSQFDAQLLALRHEIEAISAQKNIVALPITQRPATH